jgi:head-tail adaptor
MRPAYLEGFSEVPSLGWTLTIGAAVYYIGGVRDIVEAGGLIVANVIAESDLLWTTGTFERVTQTADDYGAYADTWATLSADVPVGLMAVSGAERWASSRVEAVSQWRAWCSPVAGLTERDRVVIDGTTYNIRFVDDIERRGVWQVLDLSQGVAT